MLSLSESKGILLIPLCLSLNMGRCLPRMIIWWRWVFSLELRVEALPDCIGRGFCCLKEANALHSTESIYRRRFIMQKPIKDGLTRYRSQATAQSSAGMTSLLRPAEAIEKTQPERLSFPRTPHSGRPRSAIPDTKRLHEKTLFDCLPIA